MKRLLFTAAAVFIPFFLSAQETAGRIAAGVVLDKSTSNPVEFVTVALTDGQGNICTGTSTDSAGVYRLPLQASWKNKALTAHFTFVGYKEAVYELSELKEKGEGGKLMTVFMEEDPAVLQGAVVSGKRELIEHKFDRLVLNVSELAVAQTGSALDVLKSSPGVTVDKDGNVQLNGRSVAVWIDGRPSQMSGKDLETYLKGSAGTSIEKVELISNPSAKYDAEGSGGIINIKTKKGFMKGLNGSVGLNAGMNFFPRTDFNGYMSAQVMYKTDKTNTSFRYNPGYWGYSSDASEYKLYGEDNTSAQESFTAIDGYSANHNIDLSNDWNISDKDIFGVILRARFNESESRTLPGGHITDYRNAGSANEKVWSVLNSTNDSRDGGEFYSANLNYTRTFDEDKSQELTLNADYSRNTSDVKTVQRNIYDRSTLDPDAAALEDFGFDDFTDRCLDLYSFKADYTQAFWKQTGRLEAGAKAAVSVTRNYFGKFDYDNAAGAVSDIPAERNDFVYNEQVYAAYINVAKQFSSKWNAQLGVRSEYTRIYGDWSETAPTSNGYIDFFPNAFLSYMPSQKVILTTNYSYRISRPKYWQLNPFRSYVNATTYSQGDPRLEPSYSHNVSLTAVLFGRLSVSGGYSMTKNFSMTQVPRFDTENGIMALIYANAGNQESAFASVSLSELPLTKWWNLTLNCFYNYSVFKAYPGISDGFGTDYDNRGGSVFLYASTTFFLPKAFKLSLDGLAATSQTSGYFTVRPLMMFNFSAEKSFWDGKGTLAFRVNDFLNTLKSTLYIENNGVRTFTMANENGQFGISLGFTWRFGSASQSTRRNVGTLDEESRL